MPGLHWGASAPRAYLCHPKPPACVHPTLMYTGTLGRDGRLRFCSLGLELTQHPAQVSLPRKPHTHFSFGLKGHSLSRVPYPDSGGWRGKLTKHFLKSRFGEQQRAVGAMGWGDSVGVTRRVKWAGGLPGGGEGARCPLQAALRCSCILYGPSSVFLPSHCSLGPFPRGRGIFCSYSSCTGVLPGPRVMGLLLPPPRACTRTLSQPPPLPGHP